MLSAFNRAALWVAGAALVLMSACKAYDADRLGEPPASGAGQGAGGGGGGSGAGAGGMVGDGGSAGTGDSGMCSEQAEACNLLDDDCDGDVDEDTIAACEAIVIHAVTECVESRGRARCLKVRCLDGFTDGDGDPTNGCETAVDDGDGGADDDAGS